jgi:hypothetical protein
LWLALAIFKARTFCVMVGADLPNPIIHTKSWADNKEVYISLHPHLLAAAVLAGLNRIESLPFAG